ncbi:MAG: hypothetical protein JNM00_10515 [Flavobacteriales bacterium]|nr:hypothetical protein [Flavobacteriales bacterium]
MPTDREELRFALHSMLSDVIEQGFQVLVHQPQHSDEINRVIKDATDELNQQLARIDHHSGSGDQELQQHYSEINRDVHRKSLELLSRLQKMQPPVMVRDVRSD